MNFKLKIFVFFIFILSSTCVYGFFLGDFFGILDYKPVKFQEKTSTPFFYSIGKNLYYNDTISEKSTIIFKGDLVRIFVSPNNTKALVVSGNNLYLVQIGESPRLFLENIFSDRPDIAMGKVFYNWSTLLWSPDSKTIYIAKDMRTKERYPHHDAVLMSLNIETGEMIPIINDFAAFRSFIIADKTICYDYARRDGNTIWKCYDDGKFSNIQSYINNQIVLENGKVIEGKSFAFYLPSHMIIGELGKINDTFKFIKQSENSIGLFSKTYSVKPIFILQGGHVKGHMSFGMQPKDYAVLPGGRYLYLDVYHDNFKGELLVDSLTGQYRELPQKTKVYLEAMALPAIERIKWSE